MTMQLSLPVRARHAAPRPRRAPTAARPTSAALAWHRCNPALPQLSL
ncbi:MAG: hypothetical protein K6T87_16545 [Roseiflexus sp.]|nr:hypothetical protein [Roseiflexus sp.]MCL6542167.1 hypothetical protein [Roseiflexus sp.]